MKAAVLSKFSEIWLPSTALMIFVTVFVVMLFFVWRKSGQTTYEEVQNLPFKEGKKK